MPDQDSCSFISLRIGMVGDPERMTQWMDVADQETSEWRIPSPNTYYPHQIEEYWRHLKNGEDTMSIIDTLENEE